MLIKEILVPGLKTISSDASMAEAEKILKEYNFRHLPVIEGNNLVGILSDRDIQRAMTVIISADNKSQSVIQTHKKVSEYMSSPVHTLRDTDPVESAVKDMISKKISCIVIQDQTGGLLGIITTEDLMILLLDQLQSNKRPARIFKKLFHFGS